MDKFVTVTRKRSAQNKNESSSAGNRDEPSSSSGRKSLGSICIAEDEADNESVVLMSDKDLGARKSKQYKRCFQQAWLKTWSWLSNKKATDRVHCSICFEACTLNLLCNTRITTRAIKDSTFVETGFSNWKKARDKFHLHEKSALHMESMRAISLLKNKPVTSMILEASNKQQQIAKTVLNLFFRSIKFLGRQGLPLRGHENRDGNFWQLMLERTSSLPDARQWLLKRDNWTSNVIQNEILQLYGHAIQRQIVRDTQRCSSFGLVADGTTDISGTEQFSCCLQFVDSKLKTQNMFLCVKDTFIRLNLPQERLRGYCFDGAANMSGRIHGVQAKLKAANPGSLYIHCSNHALDLVLQEAAKEVRIIADALNFVRNVSVIITQSPKRKCLFQSLFGTDQVVTNLLVLCPTRWCVRASAVSRLIKCYPTLLQCLETLQQDHTLNGETRAKIHDLVRQAKMTKIVFGIFCSEAIFGPSEKVARTLQSKNSTALSTLEAISILKSTFSKLRTDHSFSDLMIKVNQCLTESNLNCTQAQSSDDSTLKGDNELFHDQQGKTEWKRQYFEVLDLVNSAIERRFNQNDMKVASKRENTFLDGANRGLTLSALEDINLPDPIDRARLVMELTLLRDYTADRQFISVQELADFVTELNPQTRIMFKQVTRTIELCLSLPVSAASSERSFSALKRLKTWLRSTMTQKRLTHTSLMHVHQEILDSLDVARLMSTFVSKTAEPRAVFGVVSV